MGNPVELEATWEQLLRIWWAMTWRMIPAAIGAFLTSGAAGFIVGFILGMLGVPVGTIQVIGGMMGLPIGLAFSLIPLKMVVGRDFGTFRLVLISSEPAAAASPEPIP